MPILFIHLSSTVKNVLSLRETGGERKEEKKEREGSYMEIGGKRYRHRRESFVEIWRTDR